MHDKRMILVNPNARRLVWDDPLLEFQRQRFMQVVGTRGWEASGSLVVDGTAALASENWVDGCGGTWRKFLADPQDGSNDRARSSAKLIDWITEYAPEVVVTRSPTTQVGVDLRRGSWVFVSHLGYSIRGRRYLSVLDCDIALVETPQQRRQLMPVLGRSRAILLPKQIPDVFRPGNGHHRYDVVVISNFIEYKNHRALESLVKAGLRIALVGSGPLLPEFQERWKSFDTVTFFGQITSVEVADVLRSGRILVHPSHAEGLPRVVIEAFASGVPVVALKSVVGWPLKDGVNGRRVPESELLEASLDLLHSDRYGRYSQAALETFKREFSREVFDAAVDRCLREIDAILDTGRNPRTSRTRKIRKALDSLRPGTFIFKVSQRVGRIASR